MDLTKHRFAQSWAMEFKGSTVVFPATRGWRLHEKEPFEKMILDRQNPQLPNVEESTFRLIPWLGFNGVKLNHPDESPRGEYSVYLPQAKLLFTFDILLPSMPPWFTAKPVVTPSPRPNFGGILAGFHVADSRLCGESAKSLLELDVEICVFSHGDFSWGAVLKGREIIAKALYPLQTLVSPKQ